jgi:Peptidase family M1 domain
MEFRAFILPALMVAANVFVQTAARTIEPNGHAQSPNAQKDYAALRADLPGAEGVAVKDLRLEREGGTFHFEQGEFYFYALVEGRVTGAVFVGKGRFDLAVKDVSEQRSLALLTKSASMVQDFTTLVLRFTDGTAEEIRKASTGAAGAPDGHVRGAAEDLATGFRKHLHENLELRLLADVLGENQGDFFLASFRMGGALTGRNALFIVDPDGTFHSAPDEVELTTWSDFEVEPWAAYRMQPADVKDRGVRTQVTDEKLDVTFDRSGMMKTSAETSVKLRRDGVRIVRLNLYPTLRVSGVYSESGAPLEFVQEAKEYDPAFAVILPEAARAGQILRLLTVYSGKDALRSDGNDTYYLMPGARESWYPSGQSQMGDFANFHMTFHLPKQLQIIATGKQVSLTPEGGGLMKAVWETGAPIPVAGFNLGGFKTSGVKTPQGFGVDAYADIGLPDMYAGLAQNGTLGNLTTVTALKGELSQGTAAIQIYSDFFGKLPYDHIALTEQTACNFGQSWPMLVYLPICGFWDTTIQHQLHLLDYDASYWREVTPHEISHQWWGNLVGFSSYRDQWMSEGFANFSVGVFLMGTSPKMDDYRAFWKEQQRNLLQKNTKGVRPIDAGSLTMGARVSNSKSGEGIYQMLIYSKGAYVLHMMEMQFWSPTDGEAGFKRSMQQFVSDYSGKAATTEDWKASLEKTMPKSLDLRGDGRLDWFFDEYVYGTELPHYVVSSDFSVADGATSVHMKLTQSNVSKNFVMRIPIYLQMENGTVRIANVVVHGSDTFEHTFVLGKLPSPGKAILVNYNADVLSDN